MSRIFGFLAILALTVGSAEAALLASWTYEDGDKAGTPLSGVAASVSEGTWNGDSNGYATANFNTSSNTGATRTETFYISATGDNTATVESVVLAASRLTGTRNLQISGIVANKGTGGLDAGSFVEGSNVALTRTPGPTTNLSSTPTDFEGVFNSPVILSGSEVLRVRVTVLLASGTTGSASAKLDNIGFVGTVVPEPASIAIFGLLGAGVVARRMRRK
jgi:hypothetical protein